MERKVRVAGLSFASNESDIKHEFDRFGNILDIKIIKDKNNSSKGVAFITYKDPRDAKYAVSEMDRVVIRGSKLFVSLESAQRKTPSDEYSPQRCRSPEPSRDGRSSERDRDYNRTDRNWRERPNDRDKRERDYERDMRYNDRNRKDRDYDIYSGSDDESYNDQKTDIKQVYGDLVELLHQYREVYNLESK